MNSSALTPSPPPPLRQVPAIPVKWLTPVMAGLLSAVLAAEETVDWRLELLKENGLPTETEALKQFLDGISRPGTTPDQSLRQLGSVIAA